MSKTVHARHPYPHHFTASGIVLHASHVLLVFHKRLNAWVPPGGHVEPHETPEETAVREILEETGLRVRVLGDAADKTDPEAFFLTQPAYMQCVTAREKAGDFYHIDVAFACLPVDASSTELPPLSGNTEVEAVKWVSLDSLDKLPLAKNVAEGVRHSLDVFRRFGVLETAARPSYNNMQ